MKYPVSMPCIGKEELENIKKTIETNWISSAGSFVKEFEEEFAKYCGRAFGTSTANGTVAIQLALMALDIKPGDEVIVPSFTFIGAVNPIALLGAKPVFVDLDPQSLTLDPAEVKQKISSRTKAIIAVPVYGHACGYDELENIANLHSIPIIEDAAEAHGTEYKGKKCGGFGTISCFSFYGNKIITTGEGGMCLTDDPGLHERMTMLKNHGMSPHEKYKHPIKGTNFRMTNMQAAVGCAQLEKIEMFLEKRRQIAAWYEKYLSNAIREGNLLLQPKKEWSSQNYWFFSIILPKGRNREEITKRLKVEGIDSRPFFFPVHKQESYVEYVELELPRTEEIAARGLNLPTHPQLTEQDVKHICEVLEEIL